MKDIIHTENANLDLVTNNYFVLRLLINGKIYKKLLFLKNTLDIYNMILELQSNAKYQNITSENEIDNYLINKISVYIKEFFDNDVQCADFTLLPKTMKTQLKSQQTNEKLAFIVFDINFYRKITITK
jgi:hypothetical protein